MGPTTLLLYKTAKPKDTPAAKPSHADAATAAANKGTILIPPCYIKLN